MAADTSGNMSGNVISYSRQYCCELHAYTRLYGHAHTSYNALRRVHMGGRLQACAPTQCEQRCMEMGRDKESAGEQDGGNTR